MGKRKEILDKIHIEYLSKASTAKINGSEMTVLPYGYLQQACDEAMTQFALHIAEQAVKKEISRKDTAYLYKSVSEEVGKNILSRIKQLTND